MTEIVGNKNVFGFEYNIQDSSPYLMGNIRVWIKGRFIGCFEDTNILPTIINQFDNLETFNSDGCKFNKMDINDVFKILSNPKANNYRYFFSPGEAFDDFIIITYACNNEIIFL